MIKLKPTITVYDGYCTPYRIYIKGRVFKTRFVRRNSGSSIGGNFIETLLRFVTREYCNAKLTLHFNNQSFEASSDKEGYFIIDAQFDSEINQTTIEWIESAIQIDHPDFITKLFTARLLFIPDCTKRIVISDIDDTIMWSYVTSYLKIKMMYFTFTRSPFQRSPVNGMNVILRSFIAHNTPIFYVSNSPWNIYPFLKKFIQHYSFPDGPTFLRDYGRQLLFRNKKTLSHKLETLHRLISTFNNQKIVLFGDSAEIDIDYYLEMYRAYGSRIDQILIHDVGHNKNRERILELIQQHEGLDIQLCSNPINYKLNY